MGSSIGLFNFGLIVCGLWISPTYGFIIDQPCASFHSAVDYGGGEALNVTEGSRLSDMEGEQMSMEKFWNVTMSFQVEPGCILNACNESYYSGECRDFTEGQTTLPSPFENILSASCTCPKICKCEDVNNIRKNSCARAYVSEEGCNSCSPYYTDIKEGESTSFPEQFETKVKSLMVRSGCNLTVYDEPDLKGESPIIVENIVQNWTQPVLSYECSCSPDAPNVTPTAPPPRPSNYPPLIDIPGSLEEIVAMMKGDYGNHPGLRAALQSNRVKRSTKNAYILVLGTTGAGKSSTINMLFDNPTVTKVGTGVSTTKEIHEFRIPIPVDELGIGNSELRVIDTPGLGDTEGIEKDARFLATLEEYLDGHEELKTRIPNVVLIFHKFSDNRYVGDGSQFVRMIRALDSFKGRLTDKKYSNVIFVFSHFLAEPSKITRNPKQKLNALKRVIEDFSRFPRPVVLAVAENKAADHDLPMINGYFKLPNGEFYPKNLFDRIAKLTRGGGDTIGEAVVRSAFRNPDSFKITSSSFSLSEKKNDKIPKYLSIISDVIFQVEKTELSEKLANAHEKMSPELKQRFPGALGYLQKSLSLDNLRREADLPRTPIGIVKLFTELRQNEAVLFLLKEAFDLSPSVYKEDVLTGFSYNVFKDLPLKVSPFEMGELQNSDIGYQFPSMITCNVDFQNRDILHFFKNRTEYLDERLKSLNIGGKISLAKFSGITKPGHNVLAEITSSEGNLIAPITAVRETRTFELVLNDKFTLTNDFKNTVKRLTPYNETDHDSVLQWTSFFNEYGTHVVKSVYGGGAIQIELNTNKTFSIEIAKVLLSFIQFAEDISLGKVGNSSVDHEGVQHSLKFVGGENNPRVTDLTKLPLQEAADLLETWKESLVLSPTILTSEMRLLPISEITRSLGKNISSEIKKATELLFDSSLTYSAPRRSTEAPPDRQSTEHVQTSQMLAMFLEKMMEQAQRSDDRLEKMMLSMKEDQKRIDENRERQHNVTTHILMMRQDADMKMRQEDQIRYAKERAQDAADRRAAEIAAERREKDRRDAEREHNRQMGNLQTLRDGQTAEVMKEMIAKMPNGSCLREGTLILMEDFTEKRVELLEVGETVLDHNLEPVKVKGVLRKLLVTDSFHGFDNETFFFTDTHLLIGRSSDDKLQIFTKELNKTLLQNPLLSYLNVEALPRTTEILGYNPETKRVRPEEVVVFTDPTRHPPTTPVYTIIVEGESGSYFANGFVCRHDIPPLHLWPHTLSVLFSLASAPEIKWIEDVPYNLETIDKIHGVLRGSYVKLVEILKEAEEGGSVGDGVAPDGLALSDEIISEVFGNPSFSEFAVGIYGTLGPTLADKMEVDASIRSDEEVRRLQFVVYEGLKEYFAKALSHAFQFRAVLN